MFTVPVDAWYVWIGLTVFGLAAFGAASAIPSTPPPDADGAAETVDAVAASQYAALGEHPVSRADEARLGSDSLSLRGPGGTAHASFGYGSVVPATEGDLERVLLGDPPGRVYEDPAAFTTAVDAALDAEPQWKPVDGLVVRRVSWEGVDVTLVG